MIGALISLLLACDSEPPEPTAAEKAEMMVRYTAALTDEDVAGCLALSEALSTECAVGIAQVQAKDSRIDAASQTCAAMAEGQGRDECAFEVVDTARLTGQAAASLCAGAGQFEKDCINHAASRDVEERILRYAGAGNERIVLQQVFATLRKYTSDDQATIMSQDMVGRWLERRWERGTPLIRSVCGSIGPDVCAKVYLLRVVGSSGMIDRSAPWREACRAPISIEVARSYSLPTWEREMGQTANNAWVMLCSM